MRIREFWITVKHPTANSQVPQSSSYRQYEKNSYFLVTVTFLYIEFFFFHLNNNKTLNFGIKFYGKGKTKWNIEKVYFLFKIRWTLTKNLVQDADRMISWLVRGRWLLYWIIWKQKPAEGGRPFLCALLSSAIHHQVKRLFTAGVKVPDTCLRALSDEPLLLKCSLCMQRPHWRSYLSGPLCPGAKAARFNQIHKTNTQKDI